MKRAGEKSPAFLFPDDFTFEFKVLSHETSSFFRWPQKLFPQKMRVMLACDLLCVSKHFSNHGQRFTAVQHPCSQRAPQVVNAVPVTNAGTTASLFKTLSNHDHYNNFQILQIILYQSFLSPHLLSHKTP